MSNVKISVIMPVYKVEKYVGKAIESILNQTFTDFELIAVDDGTPDKSGEICEEYARKDSRIKVLHKENGGAPSARNMAIEIAGGKYFYFMDSDDWAEPTMLEDMYNLAEETNAQYVVTGYYIDTYYSDTEYLTLDVTHPDRVYESQEAFRLEAYKLFDKNLLYTPWNKLYLASYILENNIRFPKTFWDDFPFNLSVLRDVQRVAVSSKQYYHFMRARAESETAKYMPKMYEKREEEHGWMLDLYEHWGISDPDSREFLARRYVERLIGCIENVTNKNCELEKKEKKAEIKRIITTDRAIESLKTAKPHSLMMKIMLIPLRLRSGNLTYLMSTVITKVKSGNTKLFATLKARR
ncbi:MAG TPA: glycosyltransferase family 2 protein [Clostridiales bacterium]|nr:glycosyltransferase family 2 protein [Clostridiales bacterium]